MSVFRVAGHNGGSDEGLNDWIQSDLQQSNHPGRSVHAVDWFNKYPAGADSGKYCRTFYG
jgi:hypothetical protein